MSDEKDEEIKEVEKEVEKEEVKEPEKQATVPHAALHEARMQNKAMQEEVRAARESQVRMERTFQKLLGSLNEKPIPKYDEDPLGHIASRNDTLEKELKSVSEKLDGMTKQSTQTAFMAQMTDQISGSEAEFRTQHPDYDAALKYLKDVTRSDLADQGMDGDQIEQTLQAGKLGLAHAAVQQGKNPAQVIYERAKRYGFKASKTEDKIETLVKGQEMNKTVEGGQAAGLSLRDLAQLPEDQLDAIVADEAKFKALIQGRMVR